ncbi:sugar phosphate isomerase/epimerase [Arthrobacter sp. SLBN-112]|jgi:sugar phosphate isomerase/epimerase|uniref:sugar phosphate isomerase/epimerase family protein n=1 Tax=Arthrobacter sp. SLBN-112 TaxID=2768452 RepID=UPI0011518744|nr:sugar phosphate isomerase/epimerase family protein [Arthrobacter sp. SLBN-112]TQJ40786.1 sugar phosphate isomerase/epimerase [Arthrobacter sp. SLBN-112]
MITPSASTLGAPGVPLDVVLSWLQQHRIHGIELRLAPGEIADPGLGTAARNDLRRRIQAAGVQVTGIASYVKVAAPGANVSVVAELIQAIDFARDLGAPMVRVFPGADTRPAAFTEVPPLVESRAEVDERAARRLSAITPYAADLGVLPVLETHDSHPTGTDVAGILNQVDGPVGVVWDVLHPWRVGEPLDETWKTLEPWLTTGRGWVQIKDANMPASSTPLPIGKGSLPTEEFGQLLVRNGYRGPVTLEWEKAWYPQAAQLDVALGSVRTWFDRHWEKDIN